MRFLFASGSLDELAINLAQCLLLAAHVLAEMLVPQPGLKQRVMIVVQTITCDRGEEQPLHTFHAGLRCLEAQQGPQRSMPVSRSSPTPAAQAHGKYLHHANNESRYYVSHNILPTALCAAAGRPPWSKRSCQVNCRGPNSNCNAALRRLVWTC